MEERLFIGGRRIDGFLQNGQLTAPITATVRIGNQHGDLQIKNSGVFRATGELTELETITGSTDDFVGTTGLLFVAGTSGETAGTFTYAGTVCLR